MLAFVVIVTFVLGFFVGAFERKADGLKVSRETFTEIKKEVQTIAKKIVGSRSSAKSEVLVTPSDEEHEKEEAVEFYKKLR